MRILFLLFSFPFLLIPLFESPLHATHQVGSDMTWRCDPNDPCIYIFTYTFYRDCPMSNVQSSAPPLNFTCLGGGSTPPTSLGPWTQTGPAVDVTPLCAGQQSDCNGGNVPGVQRVEFTRRFNFCTGNPCNEYRIDGRTCCRSNLINSITNPTSAGSSTTSLFTFDPNTCNSSPTFNNDPIVYLCDGQPTTISLGATDPEGDGIVYSLVPCETNTNASVTYDPGFSATSPLGPNWNVTLDNNNGQVTFDPINAGNSIVTVMCVRVDEIRNGVVVSSIVRDMEIRVIDCNNQLPDLSGVDGSSDFSIDMCVGKETCFDVNSIDADAQDILSVNVVSNGTGANITMSSPPRPVTTICWTPTTADIGSHTIILEVQDNACPTVGTQQIAYTINVAACDPCDSLNQILSWNHSTNLLDITVNNTTWGGGITFTEYSWGDGSAKETYSGNHTFPVNHTFPGPGTYEVCVKTYTYIGDVCCHDSLCKTVVVTNDPCDEHEARWSAVALENPECTYIFTDASTPGSSQVYWDFGLGMVYSGSPLTFTFPSPSSGIYTITMTSVYHPPSNPSICCYDTVMFSWNIHCGMPGPIEGNISTAKTTSLAWHEQNSVLEVQLSQTFQEKPGTVAEIYDLQGKLLQVQESRPNETVLFDFSRVSSGIYLVRLRRGDLVETRKFVKP